MDAYCSDGLSLLTSGVVKIRAPPALSVRVISLKAAAAVKNILEDILSNDEIESFIRECLVLEVLAAVTREGMGISKTQRRY